MTLKVSGKDLRFYTLNLSAESGLKSLTLYLNLKEVEE
jgi:hypothetical protein